MALHLGKSHGRQVNQGRNAFPQATLLPIVLLALCTFHAGCASSTPRDQSAVAAAKPSVETRRKDVTERLKQDVDRLIATDFQDSAAISAQLHTQLGPLQLDGERELRVSESGVLAGEKLQRVELSNATDDPSRGKLLIDFSPPGPTFGHAPWPDTMPYPPRPDAPDSRAYWVMTVDGKKVTFGLTEDQSHLSYISINKM
ncbi:hypothetical protein [Xanthomonas vesicatoria]|uniref:hypothetical protein n=1 Tax=Xanthomonas vesicatoria TaxID=56460 RepID=UPI0009380C87|nr:hypothetical protein [Xanthomonas vesicatoria]APP76425.1 hypothetical protein BJD12_15635 [Xanthomonas vesicatoria ATCC 35937]MCC8557477.1 hypothetical protein [Xanthomonas vesicatoria]MCC8595511.1 hypothetical protein [Xanthomonas vesicatoria]MCC8600488.1 hypothetical protein [Xanthomonas vesicatoria]MCC8604939.1 hypothetical protein [Xanthomonas vesicatoria]